jgi:hypothetical protein
MGAQSSTPSSTRFARGVGAPPMRFPPRTNCLPPSELTVASFAPIEASMVVQGTALGRDARKKKNTTN